jgi:CRP/FNR family cyclic AMP-dependent transcriptional regulator
MSLNLWENFFRSTEYHQKILKTLKTCFLFDGLNTRELHFLRNIIHVRDYRAGEMVFRQGELGIGMYIIVSGHVDISVETPDQHGTDKKHTFVTRLMPNDFFGEISLVETHGRRTASAVAIEDSLLIGFFRPDLEEIKTRNPKVGLKIMTRLAEVLGRRLKEASTELTRLKQGSEQ